MGGSSGDGSNLLIPEVLAQENFARQQVKSAAVQLLSNTADSGVAFQAIEVYSD